MIGLLVLIALAETARGIAIFVLGGVLLLGAGFVAKWCARWLSQAIAADIHKGIGTVVREQLGTLIERMNALEVRDANGHAEVMARHADLMQRLDEVEHQNTADHGAVAERLERVEERLARVEANQITASDLLAAATAARTP